MFLEQTRCRRLLILNYGFCLIKQESLKGCENIELKYVEFVARVQFSYSLNTLHVTYKGRAFQL